MEAVKDAGIETYAGDKTRVGVCIGSGIGGLPMIEETHSHFLQGGVRKISPFFVPGSIINMISGLVSIHYGYQGSEPRHGERVLDRQPQHWRSRTAHRVR
jgi:3-oxoacyl-[acyl-carrier-protein] synthase II